MHLLAELQEVELGKALVAGHHAERTLPLAQLHDDRLVRVIQVDHMRWLHTAHSGQHSRTMRSARKCDHAGVHLTSLWALPGRPQQLLWLRDM